MLNWIWLGLVVLAVVLGGFEGRLKEVADKCFEMVDTAVLKTAFSLIGIMALWLGVMRLAERSGLVTLFARVMRPVMCRLFPEVPADHPAMGSMLMNISANMLGLGNAATPLGLRAMKDLESLNRVPGTATNAMCTFLAINTSGIQLIPVTAIAIFAANKATNPAAIVGTAILSTGCACVGAVLVAKILERLPMYRLVPSAGNGTRENTGGPKETKAEAATAQEKEPLKEAATLQPLAWWGTGLYAAFLIFFGWLFLRLAFPTWLGLPLPEAAAKQTIFVRIVTAVSALSIPFLLSAIPLYAGLRRVKVYEEFVDGAKEGFDVAIRIIPYLVAMLVAIGMFRAAGGIDIISHALAPVLHWVHFPTELLPMVLMRPLSGSGTLGMFTELVQHFGADSLIAKTAGTIYGSTETTFYVLAVYFGSVGVKRTRYAVLAGLSADLFGVIASIFFCWLVFG